MQKSDMQNRGSCVCLRSVFTRNGKAYVNNRIPYVWNSAE